MNDSTSDEPLFHIAVPEDWAAAFETGEFLMSTRGRTLDEEGFIHCSTRAQIEATANRFYGDLDELVLLTIDPEKVPSDIKWEPPVHDGDELFPHIYGPLPISAVVKNDFWTRPNEGWILNG